MSEYEKIMQVLFDRGLPSEICGIVANMFEELYAKDAEIERLKNFKAALKHSINL